MRPNYLPILRSGWFYLWFCLATLIVWANLISFWQPLEQINYKTWSTFMPPDENASKLLRVVDIDFNENGIGNIQKLAKKYPTATFAFIGNYSDKFIQLFSSSANKKLSKKTVIFSADQNSSISAIAKSNYQYLLPITHLTDINWQAYVNQTIALQPKIKSYGLYLIWRQQKNLYPSFIGQAIISHIQNNSDSVLPITINFLSQNQLVIGDNIYPIGFCGEIYSNAKQPVNQTYKDLLKKDKKTFSGIILIDDLSSPQSDKIARALASLIDEKYLTSNWLTQLIELSFVILFLWGIYRMRFLTMIIQAIIFVSGLAVLLLLQSFFISQSLWLSLQVIVLLSSISWLMQYGYTKESNIFQKKNEQTNAFLKEAVPIFYQTQNFEIIYPFLEQTLPSNQLIDSVYEIAIEAEAHKNTALAKKLHLWILSSQPKFKPSKTRMLELTANDVSASELDQTMVIGKNGKNTSKAANGILDVKSFGRYKVEGILGKGAMGIVFQGVDPKINRHVAIKTMQLSDDLVGESLKEAKLRFFREAETAGNLSHANIVTIYDVGEEIPAHSKKSIGYIAMDLLTGAPLSEFIKKGKLLPPSLVYRLMIQITDALDYAHKQKVIHRDIKPANILYDDDLQRGTLTDFGIAYMSDHSQTKTGTIMGSPFYMSPEQIIGIKVDGRSDIFSLGVTFYQLLSGHLPFTGESIASVAFHITKTKQDSIRQWNKKLPTSAARITNKALQKDKNKRYQTMQEFKQALVNALKKDYKKSPLS